MSAPRHLALARAEPFGWAVELQGAERILDVPPDGAQVVEPAAQVPSSTARRYLTFADASIALALPAPVQIAPAERPIEPLPAFLEGLSRQGATGLLWQGGALYLLLDPNFLPRAVPPATPRTSPE